LINGQQIETDFEILEGEGISKALLDKASKHLNGLEFKKFILEIRVDNTIAISLYEKNSFKVVKSLKANF